MAYSFSLSLLPLRLRQSFPPSPLLAFATHVFLLSLIWQLCVSSTSSPLLNVWRYTSPRLSQPPSLSFSTLTAFCCGFQQQNLFFLFGGVLNFNTSDWSKNIWEAAFNTSSEAWIFDSHSLNWQLSSPTPPPPLTWPSARAAHTVNIFSLNDVAPNTFFSSNSSYDSVAVLVGGIASGPVVFGDVWVMHIHQTLVVDVLNATTPAPSGAPSARWAHSSLVLNNSLYLAGGFDAWGAGTVDVWVARLALSVLCKHQPCSAFNLSNVTDPTTLLSWTRLVGTAPGPAPRGFFFLSIWKATALILAGGWGSFNSSSAVLDDTWSLQLSPSADEGVWSLTSATIALAGGAAVALPTNNQLYVPMAVWGTHQPASIALASGTFTQSRNSSYIFNGSAWLQIKSVFLDSTNFYPLLSSAAACVDNSIYLYGGYDTFRGITSQMLYIGEVWSSLWGNGKF